MPNPGTPREMAHTDSAALHARRAAGEPVQLVDVREPHEHAGGVIDGALLMPMATVPSRWTELDPSRPVYVICHLGARSARVAAYLLQQGLKAVNVDDGMEGWQQRGFPTVR